MYVIVGLGNPGRKYEGTRHNAGFQAVDRLAALYSIEFTQKKLLLKPQTYMNLSGESVREAVEYYKADPEQELLVIYDDISLEPGKLRIRKKGSAGGHNGIKNIIQHLGTQVFPRIKIGVGGKPEGNDLVDHVLGHFSGEDIEKMKETYERAAKAAAAVLLEGPDQAMNEFN